MSLMMYKSHNKVDAVEELSELAGDATEPPPPPVDGIPRQWLPGFIRWPIRVILLPFVIFDLAIQKVVLKVMRPPFRQEGRCHQRGNCCYYILLPEPKGIIGRISIFWYTQVNGFFLRDPKPIDSDGEKLVVMGCRYLQKNGRCAHYRLRPTVCRQWPMINYFGYPRILKGCGYRAVRKK